MSGFNLSNLIVVHVYNYIKPTGDVDLLASLTRSCNAVTLSTCMRHVYLFNAEIFTDKDQIKAQAAQKACRDLNAFVERNDQYSALTQIEFYTGNSAYHFLLIWMIAGLNPKKLLSDHRILGDVREVWAKMNRSTGARNQQLVATYKCLFNDLFSDVISLRAVVDDFAQKNEPLQQDPGLQSKLMQQLKLIAARVTWTRANGFSLMMTKLNYALFLDDSFVSLIKEKLQFTHKTLQEQCNGLTPGGEVGFFKSMDKELMEKIKGINLRLQLLARLLENIEQQEYTPLPDKLLLSDAKIGTLSTPLSELLDGVGDEPAENEMQPCRKSLV